MAFRDPFSISFPEPPWFDVCYNEEERRVYELFKNAMQKNKSSVDLENCRFSDYEIKYIIRAIIGDVISDNPLLYRYNGCEAVIENHGDGHYTIDLLTKYDNAEIEVYNRMVSSKVEELYYELGIDTLRSEFEIELAVNDWVVENCTWHREFASPLKPAHEFYSLLGILLDGRGVCASVAAAVNVLLNSFGVECYTVTGEIDGKGVVDPCMLMSEKDYDEQLKVEYEPNHLERLDLIAPPPSETDTGRIAHFRRGYHLNNRHAWNLVRIDDEYLHLDVTFNLNGKYDFFNVPTERLKIHRPDWISMWP